MKTTEEIREEQAKPRTVGDMKHGLGGARPALSLVPRTAAIYGVRATEYGADKYARGNYHGPPPAKLGANAGVMRLLGYIDATMRHLMHVSDKINRALGTGGDLAAACACVDDEASGNFPASMLPHLAHALASMNIGISCAVDDGLLPADPGQPWKKAITVEAGLPQKDNPAAEKARVAALTFGAPVEMRKDPQTGYIVPVSTKPDGSYATMDEAIAASVEYLKKLPDVDVQAKTSIDFPKRREPNQ